MKTSKYSYLMMLGHICTDINQGALPAILPFLIAQTGINYASAAALIFASNCVSSVVQPLFGYLGDKAANPWFMSLGMLLAGGGLATVGFWDSYWQIFLAVMVSGLGIAMFHPEAGRIANLVGDKKKGQSISIFAVGGNLGFAIGPLLASAALYAGGLKGTVVLIIPVFIMSLIFLTQNKTLKSISEDKAKERTSQLDPENAKDNWPAFSKLSLILVCRSVAYYGLMTFIPLYWVDILLQSETSGSTKLTIFSLSCAAATLIGGRIADRFGYNSIIKASFIALLPFLLIFTQTTSVAWATLLIIPLALTLNISFSSLVALGQGFLPNRLGFASGIIMGLTVSVGGMSAPALGWIGDNFGLHAAMYAIGALILIAAVLSFFIPKPST